MEHEPTLFEWVGGLPALPDEAVGFEQHVKRLFREVDLRSMSFAFDLWSHDNVAEHADAILGRLEARTMPCDGECDPRRRSTYSGAG